MRCLAQAGIKYNNSKKYTSHSCNSNSKYYNIADECNDGDIRLVGSTSPLEGRVEMCYEGVWGTVCNSAWHTIDASVVCRQLGYSSSGL